MPEKPPGRTHDRVPGGTLRRMSDSETALRFALATPDYPPDPMGTGIGTYAKSLAEGLTRRGHRVHVVTRGPEGDATVDDGGVTVHRIGVQRPDFPTHIAPLAFVGLAARSIANEFRYRSRVAATLDMLVRREGVQLVEAADSFVEALFYRAARHPKVPFVIRLHTPMSVAERFDRNLPEPARRLLQSIERVHLRRATHLSVPSATPRRTFREAMRLGGRPIEAIPNPPPGMPAVTAARTSITNAVTDPAAPEVLYVGRITAVKGVFVLADAIPKVLEKVPGAHFRFVGADSPASSGSGTTVEALRDRLPQAAAAKVTFEGRVPLQRIGAYLQGASVCVFPSLFENFPYTCLEAMAAGKAVVGSAAGGMQDMLDGGECGLLYHPPNVGELADAIVRLLTDHELRSRLGAAARRRAGDAYGEDRVFDATVGFYRRAIESLA